MRARDTLYVASTADNTIYAIDNADFAAAPVERGVVVFSDPHLRGPLGLRLAPNGHLLTANGDATANADPAFPSEIIEFTKAASSCGSSMWTPLRAGHSDSIPFWFPGRRTTSPTSMT